MTDAALNGRLREYLRELKPEARALLASELERAMFRGEGPPGASFILEALRSDARQEGRRLPRIGNPQRLFFALFEPYLVDDAPTRKHRGRISRACLDPIWAWITRDLMPRESRTYVDQVQMLLGANEKHGAEQVARETASCRAQGESPDKSISVRKARIVSWMFFRSIAASAPCPTFMRATSASTISTATENGVSAMRAAASLPAARMARRISCQVEPSRLITSRSA